MSVHRYGLSELHSGVGLNGEPPKVNIVFIHGLNGHPQETWSAKYVSTSNEPADRRTSESSGASSQARKGSVFNKFLKRTKTGHPVGLGDREMSIAHSTYTVDTTSGDTISPTTSPVEHPVDPLILSPTSTEQAATLQTPTSLRKKTFWPRDLLPQDIPNARILTFGYDAGLVKMSTTGKSAKLNFSQHAHDLCVTLNRGLADDIPVILCAHSLGGVLAKRALWESRTDNNPLQQRLCNNTKAVMFFGSPHRGSSTAGWGEIGTKLVSVIKLDSAQHLVSSLRLDSEILDNIHSDFMKLLIEGRFWVHTFQEGRPINHVLGKVVEDFSSKIDETTPMQTHEVIDGHHRNMIRYATTQDPGYRKVISALKLYITMLDQKHDIERRSIASSYSAKELPTKTYFNVPYERNENFVGREDCLETINKIFSTGPKFTPFVSLYGLGGIGKTQVAVELAYRWQAFYPTFSIFWVHATSVDRFNEGLQSILDTLGIPISAETNVRNVVETWLSTRTNGRWLLFVDNVDSEEVLANESVKGRFKLLSCIPKTDHGHVLFTSRYKQVALKLASDTVRIDQMTKSEGLELIKVSLKEQYSKEQEADAERLLEELSYIPLAVCQACAFIRHNDSTIADYLELYQESEENKMELLEQSIAELGTSDPETPKMVLKTSWMSFDRLKTDGDAGDLAIQLISIMAFLDRQEVPISLIKNISPKAGSVRLTKALGSLKTYSLVTENAKTRNLSMHRLVQLSMRKWLEREDTADKYREVVLALLSEHFPDGSFKTWPECKGLIVHADTVLKHTHDSPNLSGRAKLLQNCGNFQNGRGQYAAAEAKFAEVVKLRTELVGADNTETLRAQDQLAWTLRNQAKKEASLALAKKTLAQKEQVFGKSSAEALTTSHIIGTITGDAGQHQKAAAIHSANLDARKELLGTEHPDTLRSAASLALELWELGSFSKAEDLARQTLAARKALLGEEHPDTLEIAATLGFILEIQGKYQEAKELKESMLLVREALYGEDHPDTADSCHDVAWILHQMGAYDAAAPYYARSLAAKLRLLGYTHPKTLVTLCNYPVFYCDRGDYEQAEARSKRLVDEFTRVQGAAHPQTLDAQGDLAVILRHAGKLDEAAAAARASIDGRNAVLGPDHPWTLPTVAHWGYVRALQGALAEGEAVIRGALAALEKTVGPDAANVLTARVYLSKTLLRQAQADGALPDDKRLQEAEELARRVLEGRTRLLGEHHPYTHKTMHHLARVVMARGLGKEAVDLSTRALGGLCRALGSEHPDVSLCDLELREMEAKAGEGEQREMGEDEVHVIDI